ncbi:MAG: DMT family transporter [Rhodospirillales bacterium]
MTADKPPPAPGPVDIVLLLVLSTVWSLSFGAIKVAVETVTPLTLSAARIALAAVVLYLLMRLRGGRLPDMGRGQGREWCGIFAVALLGNGLPFFLIGWGEVKISSGLAAILMAVMPLTTALIAHVFTAGEKLNRVKLAGITCGFSGVAVLVGADVLAGMGNEALRQAAVAAAATCYAAAAVIAKRMPPADPVNRSAAVIMVSAVQMIPVMLIFDAPWTLSPSPEAWAAIAYLGLFPTALAALIYFRLVLSRGATFLTYNNYLIPVMGVGWGMLFLGETAEPRALLALGLVLIGIAIATYGARKDM